MFPQLLSDDMLDRIARWSELKRWERREIGQELRKMGFSYREIASVIPVAKGTLSGWCRDIQLSPAQVIRLQLLHPNRFRRNEVGHVLRRRAKARAKRIRDDAHTEAGDMLTDPAWVAGVVAYWSEGAKRQKDLVFSNSDPALVALFIEWARWYLDLSFDRFTAKLHLHAGQDESERKSYWASVTGIPESSFRKTYIKPEGTGHRKNLLYNGTIQVRVTRSTDILHRVMGWIEAVASQPPSLGKLSTGR